MRTVYLFATELFKVKIFFRIQGPLCIAFIDKDSSFEDILEKVNSFIKQTRPKEGIFN